MGPWGSNVCGMLALVPGVGLRAPRAPPPGRVLRSPRAAPAEASVNEEGQREG